jgi:hypothetical protein
MSADKALCDIFDKLTDEELLRAYEKLVHPFGAPQYEQKIREKVHSMVSGETPVEDSPMRERLQQLMSEDSRM